MAEDLVRIEPDEGPQTAAGEARDEDAAPPPYQNRFQLFFGVLLGVAMAALVVTVVVIAGGGRKTTTEVAAQWAPWHPTSGDGLGAVHEIADYVGRRYRLPSGHQLVAVTGSPLEYAQLPATIAVAARGQYTTFDGDGVTYNLCGNGKNCSISEGKPSNARFIVLRREALELALYTFRYIKNVNEVVAFLPPAPGKRATFAMFFVRNQLASQLNAPLDVTLPGQPPVPPRVSKLDLLRINQMTAPNLYSFNAEVGQDAHPIVFLSPVTG